MRSVKQGHAIKRTCLCLCLSKVPLSLHLGDRLRLSEVPKELGRRSEPTAESSGVGPLGDECPVPV